ncbi:MAG: hypothetical protein M3Z04_16395 [Chloroflexota bacterium]|nr:hypothetical protein [Chloroflexota bacterium]
MNTLNSKKVRGAAAVTLGAVALAGAAFGGTVAFAQTVPPASGNTAPSAQSTPAAGTQTGPGEMRGHGGHGGPGGFGGFDGPSGHGRGGFGGPDGATTTVDGATRSIQQATAAVTLVRTDVSAVAGKTDTTQANTWLDQADALIKQAQTAGDAQHYAQAAAYAHTGADLARTADTALENAVGEANLPSAANRPARSDNGTAPTATQVSASRDLSRTYSELVAQAAQLKAAGTVAGATDYLSAAQKAYGQAYTAYGAGNWSDAQNSARLADSLSRVVGDLIRAAQAPADSTAPVTVPAPNF